MPRIIAGDQTAVHKMFVEESAVHKEDWRY